MKNITNSAHILMEQSKWIAQPTRIEKMAERFIKHIPEQKVGATIEEEEKILIEEVWPAIIAVGMLSEYFYHVLEKSAKKKTPLVMQYVAVEIAKKDWFFHSYKDQEKVVSGEMSWAKYLDLYGNRADKDYELSTPRWHEIKDEIKERITKMEHTPHDTLSVSLPQKYAKMIHTLIVLQRLRSEGKRKALIHINAFRQLLIEKTGSDKDISQLTREELLFGTSSRPAAKSQRKNISAHAIQTGNTHGKGRGVCAGVVKGVVKNILDHTASVEKDTIGIFPNASPQFAQQFPKCIGMIFLQGGQTSHGAIVAREFGIPSLIDAHVHIPDGEIVLINGETGEWEIV